MLHETDKWEHELGGRFYRQFALSKPELAERADGLFLLMDEKWRSELWAS